MADLDRHACRIFRGTAKVSRRRTNETRPPKHSTTTTVKGLNSHEGFTM
jgi:hypothetical protein